MKLSEVPALEAIVDRLHDTLKPEDLDRVRSGDLARSTSRSEIQHSGRRRA